MIAIRKLFLGLLVLAASNQNMIAHDHESLAMSIAKRSVGAAIGGGVCYWLSHWCNSEVIATHENKMKFLEDLKLYIESTEYIEQGANSRLFTHYYNGLNQLAQTTRGVEVSILQDFAQSRDALSAQVVLNRVEDLQAQLQEVHANGLWANKIILTAIGAVAGALIPFAGHESECSHGCSHGHHHHSSTTYVGNFARSVPKSIFDR